MTRSLVAKGRIIVLAAAFTVHPASPAAENRPEAEPWLSASPFSIAAQDLARAVAALPTLERGTVEILLTETAIGFDPGGRATITRHLLYRILSPGGVDAGSTVRRTWAPWRQRKPTVRGRVVDSNGTQHDLEPGALTDAPLGSSDRTIFSDMRVIEGPLPAIAPGSIVEIETVEADEEALFAAGTVTTFVVARSIPVRRGRVRIDAPESLHLHLASRPRGLFRETVEKIGETARRTFDLQSFEPPSKEEPFVPPDLDPAAAVSVATGGSWREVAEAYLEIVDRQMVGSELQARVLRTISPSMTRSEKILALVRFLHDNVRYTGVEFAWAGVVPEKPAVTLARKYGDCKDKSVLLMALLREAGIPANLALLASGNDPDSEPDLPGLGKFNHVIVRVDGDPPMWIDATDEYGEPGIIADGTEGRLALVVRAGVSALERIPETRSSDHHTVERREFFLAEEGPARVVETTTATGRPGRGYRSHSATTDAAKSREEFEQYLRDQYAAEKLDRYEWSDLKDLGKPFQLRLEASGVGAGRSNGIEIRVPISLHLLAGTLSQMVPPRAPQGEMTKGNAGENGDPIRRNDFLVVLNHVAEWQYRIHRPEGFSPLPLPEPVRRSIGPATLTADFRKESDGSVVVDAVVDTGPRRWTAGEYEEARRAMYELYRDSPWTVAFGQDGEANLKAGRLREAMEEFRRLAALHPKEALHHGQIAKALVTAGFGAAARAEASQAVDMEPRNSWAHERLGWTLLHDSLGREFRKGWDLQGAVAEFRKAKDLDPKNISARALLALTLEHDDGGVRYGPTAAMEDAIEEYRSLRKDLGDSTVDLNLLNCFGHAGRFKELREEAAKLPESEERNVLLVAATAVTGGIDGAMSEAGRLAPGLQGRGQILGAAGWMLVSLRRYPEGAALVEQGLQGSGGTAQTQMILSILKKTRRHEEISFDLARADEVVKAAQRCILTSQDYKTSEPRGIFSRHFQIEESDQRKVMAASRYTAAATAGGMFTMDGFVDLALAGIETEISPIGTTGYRVKVWNAAASGTPPFQTFLTQEDGTLRVLALSRDLAGLGRLVETLIEKGELENARLWLNQAREMYTSAKTDDPIDAHPIAILWPSGGTTDPRWMRAAAAVLRINLGSAESMVPVLAEVREQVEDGERWKLDYALAIAQTIARKHEPSLEFARRLLAIYPRSGVARNLVTSSLLSLKRIDEAENLARKWLAADASDREGLRCMLQCAHERRDVDEARKWFARLQEAGRTGHLELNNHAWFLLEVGRSEEALTLAERAVREGGGSAELHTLASVYADQARLAEARETIMKKIEIYGGGDREPADAFVFGRIAEQIGEMTLAADEFQRALGDEHETESWTRIVQDRLNGLPPVPAKGKEMGGIKRGGAKKP